MKKIDNKNGTYSLWNTREKRFILENATENEVDNLKKIINKKRRDENALSRGIR
jgi:hypothetical protein